MRNIRSKNHPLDKSFEVETSSIQPQPTNQVVPSINQSDQSNQPNPVNRSIQPIQSNQLTNHSIQSIQSNQSINQLESLTNHEKVQTNLLKDVLQESSPDALPNENGNNISSII